MTDPYEHLTAEDREWLKLAEAMHRDGTSRFPIRKVYDVVSAIPALLAEVSRLRGALRGAHRLLLSSEWCDADPEMREIVETLNEK